MIATQVQTHLTDLNERLDTAVKLLNASGGSSGLVSSPVAKETRGLIIVLLFASYENLLKSLTRTLLEAAVNCRVGNRRLRPGFKMFAIAGSAESMGALSAKKLYSHSLPKLISQVESSSGPCTINTSAFPDDGSFMKSSQIEVWCRVFGVQHPGAILRRTWQNVDSIVAQRNGIAHGRLRPDEVGRDYSETEIRDLIEDWRRDWSDFLGAVESLASTRDFFRVPR